MVIQLDTCLISFRNFNEWVGTPLSREFKYWGIVGGDLGRLCICSYRIVFALKMNRV